MSRLILPEITYQAIARWPGVQRSAQYRAKRSGFRVQAWSRIEKELMQELSRIGARDASLSLDVTMRDFNRNGRLSADARPKSSRVVLRYIAGGVEYQFPCDTYDWWQDNVWAIRLSLEALRAVNRYGVTQRGEQYVGFRALPPGPSATEAMTPEQAAGILAQESGIEADAILSFVAVRAVAIRAAKSKAHPDAGGSHERFTAVQKAAGILDTASAEDE